MSLVRPFTRSDRDQLAHLANSHIASVMPGWSVPVASLLAQLERQPGEYITDPWVVERRTIVAMQRDRLVAAAHMRRYANEQRVSDDFRDAGEIVWLICWPANISAGREVLQAALALLREWGSRVHYGDGALPTTATFGISDSWPHIRELYEEAGFDASQGQIEIQLVGSLSAIPLPGPPPVVGLSIQRVMGSLGTAFDAVLNGEVVGSYEVDTDLSRGGSNLALAGWADECNHWVREDLRGRGVGTWLVSHAAAWLRLGGTQRMLTYLIENEHVERCKRYYARFGFEQVNRTTRGWRRFPG